MIKLVKYDGHWIVAEIEEIPGTELGDPDCVLKYPCEINEDGAVPFPPFSDDKELVVRSENLTIVAEPTAMYMSLYYDLKDKETE
tara:strand:+ start:91 stop:345 length:255 start_codon:yes stop_codon:yes gene_type:complete